MGYVLGNQTTSVDYNTFVTNLRLSAPVLNLTAPPNATIWAPDCVPVPCNCTGLDLSGFQACQQTCWGPGNCPATQPGVTLPVCQSSMSSYTPICGSGTAATLDTTIIASGVQGFQPAIVVSAPVPDVLVETIKICPGTCSPKPPTAVCLGLLRHSGFSVGIPCLGFCSRQNALSCANLTLTHSRLTPAPHRARHFKASDDGSCRLENIQVFRTVSDMIFGPK